MSDPFSYQPPSASQVMQMQLVREALRAANEILLSNVPASRERSLAITKLEECSMWANKAIVFNPPAALLSEGQPH